jgi:dihydrofolate reductase
MRKLLYQMSVSLDGYVAGPGGDMAWSVPDAELHRHFNDLERQTSLDIYGRGLYEIMAGYWPTGDQQPDTPEYEADFARIWRLKPKLVFSRTLKSVDWNSTLTRADPVEEIGKLKQQPGGDLSVGGPGLAAPLVRASLVDEYSLYVFPVVLGGGKPYFPPLDKPLHLKLLETRKFGEVLMLRYSAIRDS